MIDVNNKAIEHEINFKLIKQGNLFNAYFFDLKTSEWKQLLPAYTLFSSVMGALESELGHKVRDLA